MAHSDSTAKIHDYTAQVTWTGNTGDGTRNYRSYERTWDITTPGKPVVHGSNDPLFGGNPELANPEDLLLSSVSACHMLWYLHLASVAKVVVLGYKDNPLGKGEVEANGAGRFTAITLRPEIVLAEGTDPEVANAVHEKVHAFCFIARSLNCPVSYEASYTFEPK